MSVGTRLRFPVAKATTVDPLLNKLLVVEDAAVQALLQTYLDRDVLPALLTMTGQAFSVVNSSVLTGVVRVRVDGAFARQEYQLSATPSSDMMIKAGGWRGCKHGLYAWLAELGAVQLAPGDRFRVVPARSDLRVTLNVQRAPLLQTICWVPQGSPVGEPFDDTSRPGDEWRRWFDWMGCPQSHYATTAIASNRQAFGGHYDVTAYVNKFAEFDADNDHFSQPTRIWKQSTVYTVAARVLANGNRYQCTVKGTSAGAGSGPSGVGANIVDGTARWDYFSGGARIVGDFHFTHVGKVGGVELYAVPADYDASGGVVGIYAEERVAAIAYEEAALPGKPEYQDLTLSLGCAQNDGSDPCRCEKCLNLLTVKFGVAKETRPIDQSIWRNDRISGLVRAAKPDFPFEVNDLAYHAQSPPPTDGLTLLGDGPLRVLLAAYKFAIDNYTTRLLHERWADFRDANGIKLGVYDYLALPAHVLSDARETTALHWSRFRLWLSLGIDAMNGESTTAAGAISPHWWGDLRMAWRGADEDSDLLALWCQECFGAGGEHVLRMLRRWWSATWPPVAFDVVELGLSFEDLRQADAAVSGVAAVRARVCAMQVFLVWTHYKTAWYALAGDCTEAEAAAIAEPLLRFVWSSRDTWMVHCPWVHFGIATDTRLSVAFRNTWAIPASANDYAAWRAARGITDTTNDVTVRSTFETIRAGYSVPVLATYTTPNYGALFAPFAAVASSVIPENLVSGGEAPYAGQRYIFYRRPGATGEIRIELSAAFLPGALVVWLKDAETGAVYSEEEIEMVTAYVDDYPNQHIERAFNLDSLPTGFYELVVENDRGVNCRIIHRFDCPLVRVGYYLRASYLENVPLPGVPSGWFSQYFFVPKGVTHFHFRADSLAHLQFRNDLEEIVTMTLLGGATYRIDVGGGHDQKVWRWEGGLGRILDLPEWFAPSKEQMIVPANLWDE